MNILKAEILLLCSEFCVPCGALAAFLDNGATARLAALGASDVVIADDAAALASNAAGLGSLLQPEVITDYSRLYAGLSDGSQVSQSYVGGAVPLSIGGTLAGGWQQLNFDNLYTERTLSLGYGRWWTPRWAFGAAVKQLHLAYHPDSEIVDDFGNIQQGTPDLFAQNGTARTAYAADIGALYKWTERTTLGLTVQNINEPNIALSDSDRDVVARTIRAGLASELRSHLTYAMAAQTSDALADQRDWSWTGAVEKWFKDNEFHEWGLRGSLAVGSRDERQMATGASYRLGAFEMDYAFVFNLGRIVLGDSYGNHRFSIAYRFGKDPSKTPQLNLVSITIDYPNEEEQLLDDESPEVAYHAP